jgi:hypothetical protein
LQGSVAQWLEQGIHKPKVVGSNPTGAMEKKYLKEKIFNYFKYLLFKIICLSNKLLNLEKWLSGRKQ